MLTGGIEAALGNSIGFGLPAGGDNTATGGARAGAGVAAVENAAHAVAYRPIVVSYTWSRILVLIGPGSENR